MTSNGVKTAQDIYEVYRIMPSLRLHQLRVAAVGKTLCDNLTRDVDTRAVVLACLFHDMGNIIKSDLSLFPEFCEPEGIAHWEMVKREFLETYGNDEHKATYAIARAIGLPEPAIRLMDDFGFSKLELVRDGGSLEKKIAKYADLRTGPHGVVSMASRLAEGKQRFSSKHPDTPRDEQEWERLTAAAYDMERQIFAEATIAPEDITEQSIQPLIEELRGFPLA